MHKLGQGDGTKNQLMMCSLIRACLRKYFSRNLTYESATIFIMKFMTNFLIILPLSIGNEVSEEFFMGFVHVKDVALAHVLVYENTSAAGRHLCVESSSHYDDFATKMEELYPEYKVPR